MKVQLLVLMEDLVHQKKKLIKFCLSLHYNSSNSYLFLNGKETYKFKANNRNVNFPSRFCLGSISNEFDYADSKEISFKGIVYGFSVDYSAIDKSNILNIYKYLMVKNNIWMLRLTGLLTGLVNGSNHTKCAFLNNQKCVIQPALINLHPNEYNQEFHYYPFSVKLDRCVESCNNLNDLANKVCVPNKTRFKCKRF